MIMRAWPVPVLILLASACSDSTTVAAPDAEVIPDLVTLSGTIEVIAAGTRSETVILHVDETGETVALVGENSTLLRDSRGIPATVTGKFTTEGWSVRPELRRLWVLDSAEGGDPSTGDRYED
jgi:hypothetical protein